LTKETWGILKSSPGIGEQRARGEKIVPLNARTRWAKFGLNHGMMRARQGVFPCKKDIPRRSLEMSLMQLGFYKKPQAQQHG